MSAAVMAALNALDDQHAARPSCPHCGDEPPAAKRCRACLVWRCACGVRHGRWASSCGPCTLAVRRAGLEAVAAQVAHEAKQELGEARGQVQWVADATQQSPLEVYRALKASGFDAAAVVETALVRQGLLAVQTCRALQTCDVCVSEVPAGRSLRLVGCGHVFCKACIAAHIHVRLGEGATEIKCLAGCGAALNHEEVRAAAGPAVLDTLVDRSLAHAAVDGLTWCPAGCGYAVVGSTDNWECKKCPCRCCMRCFDEPHEGKSCELAAERREVVAVLRRLNIRKCPRCGHAVQKNGGCNDMRCRCGKRWRWTDNEAAL